MIKENFWSHTLKKSENKINFPFKLILCVQAIKKMVFVFLHMNPRRPIHLLMLKCNWAFRIFIVSDGTSRKSRRCPQLAEENPPW